MEDVVDRLGRTHRLVPVSLEHQDSCGQCSMSDFCSDVDFECFEPTGIHDLPSFAYKLVADTSVVGKNL